MKVSDMVTGRVEYSMRRLTNWAYKTNCSETFKAILQDGKSRPEAVVVKIIHRASEDGDNNGKVVKRAVKAWFHEFRIHRSLQHVSQLY